MKLGRKSTGIVLFINTIMPAILLIVLLWNIYIFLGEFEKEVKPVLVEIESIEKEIVNDVHKFSHLLNREKNSIANIITKIERVEKKIKDDIGKEVTLIEDDVIHDIDLVVKPFRAVGKEVHNVAEKVSTISIFGKKIHLFKGITNMIHHIVYSIAHPFIEVERNIIEVEKRLKHELKEELQGVDEAIHQDIHRILADIDYFKEEARKEKKRITRASLEVFKMFVSISIILIKFLKVVLILAIIYSLHRAANKVLDFVLKIEQSIEMLKG